MKMIARRCRKRPGSAKAFLTALVLILMSTSPVWAKSISDTQVSEYSRRFEQALKTHKQGDWQKALATLSRVYDVEVPVQAFYDTLDRQKLEIISALADKEVISTGKASHPLGDLKRLFTEVLLLQPERLQHRVRVETELPLARLIHLYAVLGRDQIRNKPDPLLMPTAPWVDLNRALAASDPWLVSAALFLARKGQGRIEPRNLIDRWRARPDLWDDVCTEQALLFLARMAPGELARLKIRDAFPGGKVSDLEPLGPGGRARAEVWFFWRGSPGPGTRDYLKRVDCSDLLIVPKKKSNDKQALTSKGEHQTPAPETCRSGILELPDGEYRLSHRKDRARGRSRAFEVGKGWITRVVMIFWGDV